MGGWTKKMKRKESVLGVSTVTLFAVVTIALVGISAFAGPISISYKAWLNNPQLSKLHVREMATLGELEVNGDVLAGNGSFEGIVVRGAPLVPASTGARLSAAQVAPLVSDVTLSRGVVNTTTLNAAKVVVNGVDITSSNFPGSVCTVGCPNGLSSGPSSVLNNLRLGFTAEETFLTVQGVKGLGVTNASLVRVYNPLTGASDTADLVLQTNPTNKAVLSATGLAVTGVVTTPAVRVGAIQSSSGAAAVIVTPTLVTFNTSVNFTGTVTGLPVDPPTGYYVSNSPIPTTNVPNALAVSVTPLPLGVSSDFTVTGPAALSNTASNLGFATVTVPANQLSWTYTGSSKTVSMNLNARIYGMVGGSTFAILKCGWSTNAAATDFTAFGVVEGGSPTLQFDNPGFVLNLNKIVTVTNNDVFSVKCAVTGPAVAPIITTFVYNLLSAQLSVIEL